jgi:hypothetical protein
VRGGVLATDSIIRTASTSFERHGFFSLSVFAAIDMSVAELIERTPELSPQRYKRVRLSTVGRLHAAGFALLATLDWPHYDVVLPDLEPTTLDRLTGCFGEPIEHPGT